MNRIESKIADLENERKRLITKLSHYESPFGQEELARKRGYILPGEKYIPKKILNQEYNN